MLSTEFTQIFSHVNQIFDQKAYLVGGATRDHLLGKLVTDYDFTTPLRPEEIESILRNNSIKPYLVGKRFGTIGFKLRVENKIHFIEITTFRGDTYKPKNRKPEIRFTTTITEDLTRRDFTINAISLSPDNIIVDPLDGQTDIKNKVIRAIGNPSDRFKDDPLRILRAIRFASNLEFEIEQQTLQAIESDNYSLLDISKERWVQELDKILKHTNRAEGFELLLSLGVLTHVIPELTLLHPDTWQKTLEELRTCDESLDDLWAVLLRHTGTIYQQNPDKKFTTEVNWKICKHLRFGNKRTHAILV